MTTRPAPTSVLCVAVLLAACADSGTQDAPRRWSACSFVSDEQVVPLLALSDMASLRKGSGLGDIDWVPASEATRAHQVAVSRCSFASRDEEPDRGFDVVVRLAARADRSENQTRSLLRQQGYVPESIRPMPCADAALWVPDELHAFAQVPPPTDLPTCPVAASEDATPLYAHAVVFVWGFDAAQTKGIARKVMNMVLPNMRETMHEFLVGEGVPPTPLPGGSEQLPTPTADVSVEDFPAFAASVQCKRLEECCSIEEVLAGPLALDDVNACAGLLGAIYGTALSTTAEAVRRGTLEYSGSAASTCLQEFESKVCADLVSTTAMPPCLSAFTPTKELEEVCTTDFECKAGFCAQALQVQLLIDGGAVLVDSGPPPAPGREQDGGVPLDSGTLRDIPTGSCSRRATLGEPCGGDEECESGACVEGACTGTTMRPWCQGI